MFWAKSLDVSYRPTVVLSVLALYLHCIMGIQMKNFVSESCNNSNNILQLHDVGLYSNGTKWIVTGHITINSTLEAPIEAFVKVERRVLYQWIKIPCINDFGSCTYSDVCALTANDETCKEDLTNEQTILCKCPIYKGNYKIQMETEHELLSKFEGAFKGSYRASLRMFKNNESIACYNFKFKITT